MRITRASHAAVIVTTVADRVVTAVASAVVLVRQVAEIVADLVLEVLAAPVVLVPEAPAVKADRVAGKDVRVIGGVNLSGTVLRSHPSFLQM